MAVCGRTYLPRQVKVDQFTARSEDGSSNLQDKKTFPLNSDSLQIADLPSDIIHLILRNLKFENIARLRLVSKYFNSVCSFLLNTEFNYLRATMLQKFQGIKALMPRRESARRKHPLARESDIIETLHMRLSLLHMTFGKHIERKYCCFFPGEIIDEIYSILQYVKNTPNLNRAYKVTDELFDLSTMAMEYFKERIEPSLPEISFLTTDLLEHCSLIRPTTDVPINKTQLLNLECTNTIQDILVKPTNDHLAKFRKQLKKSKEIATKNRREILKLRRSMKIARKRVTAIIKELQQIKWLHKNGEGGILPEYSRLNSLLLEVKGQQQDLIASCSSTPAALPLKLEASDDRVTKSDVSWDICQKNSLEQIHESTLNPSASNLSLVIHTSSENEANSKKNLPAAIKNNKRVSTNRIIDNSISKRLSKKKRIF